MTNAKAKSLTTLVKVALGAAAALVMCAPVLIGSMSAQSLQAQTAPSFEVVSVKPNKSGDRGGRSRFQPGGYSGTNVTVRRVIDLAYQPLLHDQIVGGPDWMDSAHFDIVAKASGTPGPSKLRLMLRSMLGDRFKLAVHNETREVPVYALVVARPDRKLGPQLRMSQVVCSASPDGAPPQSPQASASQGPPCGFSLGDGALHGQGITIDMLARELSLVGRVVLDHTGLEGRFDVDLKWTPDDAQDTSAVAGGASIFTALQELLGLKLESERGSVDMLVIDHAEQPTPD